jgi:hypothetical protein
MNWPAYLAVPPPTEKTQGVRLADVLLVGPFMIWFGAQARAPEWAKQSMIGLGVLTILYNGSNYLRDAGCRGGLAGLRCVRFCGLACDDLACIWFGGQARAPDWAKHSMIGLGVLTILYNGRNYLRSGRGR